MLPIACTMLATDAEKISSDPSSPDPQKSPDLQEGTESFGWFTMPSRELVGLSIPIAVNFAVHLVSTVDALHNVFNETNLEESLKICVEKVKEKKINEDAVKIYNDSCHWWNTRKTTDKSIEVPVEEFEKAQYASLYASLSTLCASAISFGTAIHNHATLKKIAEEDSTWKDQVKENEDLIRKVKRANKKRVRMIQEELKTQNVLQLSNILRSVSQHVRDDCSVVEEKIGETLQKLELACEKVKAIKASADRGIIASIPSVVTAVAHGRQNYCAIAAKSVITPGSGAGVLDLSMVVDATSGALAVGSMMVNWKTSSNCIAILNDFEDGRKQLQRQKEEVESVRLSFVQFENELAKRSASHRSRKLIDITMDNCSDSD